MVVPARPGQGRKMSDNRWEKAAGVKDLKDRVPISVKAKGKDILLVRIGDRLFATESKCPHYGGPLNKGLLSGDTITCPWHHARFDIATGKLNAPPALDDVQSFSTKVENGEVFIGPPVTSMPDQDAGEDNRTYAVVGAGAAGNAAAETLRREGFSGRILLITAEKHPPYDRPVLSKGFLTGEASSDSLPLREKEFYKKMGIEIMTERRVRQLKPAERTLCFSDGKEVKYDAVLLATGGKPRPLPVPGADLRSVYLLRSMTDAETILGATKEAKKVVIVGSGFIGLEVAASLRHRDLQVDVASREEIPMARIFGERIGRWFQRMHEAQGVRFHPDVTAERIEDRGEGVRVSLSDGAGIDTDIVVVGLGIDPATDYLEDTNLLEDGAVAVDERLKAKEDGVFAAGDIALFPNPRTGEKHRVEHWVVAEAQGRHAARAMLGVGDSYGEIPFFWTRQYGKSIKYIGYGSPFDRVVFRGDVEEDSFFAGYCRNGQLQAASCLNGGNEFIGLSELLKAGRPPSPEAFEDPGYSFIDTL
jgi:NADPH-dependent 2,4-dienoyl-CoA reductase/sulfur reductase-like enzyme/nitrite reductase/ring-hydroxylating ferredoxin subunit